MSVTLSRPIAAAGALAAQTLTIGVEEEFLLLDAASWHNAPVADAARAYLPSEALAQSRVEFRRSMMEMVTPVCTTLPELRDWLLTNRTAAAVAAARAGARLVAVGATPFGEPDRTVEDSPRFERISHHYGPIAHDPAVCGCHVHVGVPDREVAVQVVNHLRPWLPVVQALTANSPFHAGVDTGHASWRAVQLVRWPSLGPAPWMETARDYERVVADLIGAGVMLDRSMVLWYARPSDRYPTVEIRVGDVCPTVGDTVLLTGLIRALVATVSGDIAAGRAAVAGPDHLLRAAHWNAAHTGLDGTLLDLVGGRVRPAWELVDALVDRVRPALERHGDAATVDRELAVLRHHGTGATRQRRAFERLGTVGAVMAELARDTTS
jgi:glutamate---cysteine ligase / carboxylate-amine ligase